MFDTNKSRRDFASFGLGAAALLAPGKAANGSECPPDEVRADGSGQHAGATMPKDITDIILASLPLVEETEIGVSDRLFRLRRLEIKPGGDLRRILQASGGVSARIFRMLNDVAIEAIETGGERITDEALERYKSVGEEGATFQ